MTQEELREINKRVAVEMGATVKWCEPKYGAPAGYRLTHTVFAMLEVGLAPIRCEEPISCDEGQAWQRVAKHTTDPRAADLVRQEIERRGWDCYSQCSHTDNGICYEATVGHPQWPESNREGVFADCTSLSSDSPHIALCLAFLKACEATKE